MQLNDTRLRPRTTTQKHSRPVERVPSKKTIEIHLSFPTLGDHPRIRRLFMKSKRLVRKKRIATAIIALLLFGLVGAAYAWNHQQSRAVATKPGTQNPLDMLKRGTPKYPTLLPAGKTIDQLGGWTRVSPDDREPVYAYVDTIDGVAISVSQQPLPEDFAENTEAGVKTLALANNATRTISVDGSVYVSSSTKGAQSAIFSRSGLLVLIKAGAQLTDSQWKEYIQSLS